VDETVELKEHWRAWIYGEMVSSAELKCKTADACAGVIAEVGIALAGSLRSGRKLLICGNGGSAADAQHMAAEFMNTLGSAVSRPGLPALALTTDTSFLTAYANDAGYEGVFERQILTLGNSGDVLIAISTSGNSKNILKAARAARAKGLITVGLVGEGGELIEMVDWPIVVSSRNTQHIQECFLAIEHALCGTIEQILFSNPESSDTKLEGSPL
jgi:D-sedoheptulose 7-phosphate isomerase